MNSDVQRHEYFMREALKQAEIALSKDEIPVGAVLVHNDTIVQKAYNQTQMLNDFTAHAEILAISGVSAHLQNKYLNTLEMYVTLEPCTMCWGAIFQSRIQTVCYGADNTHRDLSLNKLSIQQSGIFVVKHILKQEADNLLKAFFKSKR